MRSASPPAFVSALLATTAGLWHFVGCVALVPECVDDEIGLLQVDAVVSTNATVATDYLDPHRDHRADPIVAGLADELKVAQHVLSTLTSAHKVAGHHKREAVGDGAPVIPLVLFLGLLLVLLAAVFASSPLKGDMVKDKEDPAASLLMESRPSLSVRGASPRGSRPMTTKSSTSPETAESSPAPVGPPPICRSLILPHQEARFIIGMDHLMKISTGTLDIRGTSARTLIQAILKDTQDGGRCLSMAFPGMEKDPYMRIFAPPDANGVQPLEVLGRSAVFYGTLEKSHADRDRTILKKQNKPVMFLDTVSIEDLRTFASDMDGAVIAQATRAAGASHYTQSEGGDWKLQVKPGADAVLVTGAMLAVWLLQPTGGRLRRPSMGTPSSSNHPPMYPGYTGP